jgi:hypothetical protein
MADGVEDHRADEIKLLARDHAEIAIQALADVVGNGLAKDMARVAAAKVLLERGFGAPERRVEQKHTGTLEIVDARKAHFDALQRMAAPKALAAPRDDVIDAEFTETKPKP